jgi:hypothetical protein
MARRRQGGSPAVLLLGVGVIVFGAVAFIAALYFVIRCLFLPRHLSRGYLYPRDVETLNREIATLDKQIDHVIAVGRAYGLPFRQDGRLDGRNSQGRDLNFKLDELEVTRDALVYDRDNIEDEASRLFEVWSFNLSGRFASIISAGVYLIAIIVLARMYPETNPLGIGFMGGAASIAAGPIAYFIKRKNLEQQLSGLGFATATADEPHFETDDQQDDDDEYEPRYDHSHPHSEQPRREQAESRSWFEVLGVSADASTDEIKAAYRSAIKQCHPDRVWGLGPQFHELAEKITIELNQAYAAAMRLRQTRH